MSFDEFFDGEERECHVYERPGVVWKNSIDDIDEEKDSSGGSNDGNDPGEDEHPRSPAEDHVLTEKRSLDKDLDDTAEGSD